MNTQHIRSLLISLLMLSLAACSSLNPAPTSTPTATAPLVPSPTATFTFTPTLRPTETPAPPPTETPLPTLTPTLEPSPTVTHTPRPTATPTLAPGDVMFAADFNDLSNWMDFGFNHRTYAKSTNYTVEARHSNLYMEVPEKYTIVYAIYGKDMPFSDVQLDVDTVTSGPDLNNIALVCRANDDGWYHLSITSSGLWSIYRYENRSGYTLLRNGGSTAIHMIQRSNHLTAVCQDDTLALFVNDVKVGSVKDQTYTDGRVGIAVASMDVGGTGIQFKNLKVRLPDPDNPPGGAVAPTLAPVPTKQGAKYKWPVPPLPGTSWAGAGMQSVALLQIVPTLIVKAPDCQDFSTATTAFIQETQPVTVDDANNLTGGEWVEQWTFNYCGAQNVFQVTFAATEAGPVNVNVKILQ